jgi:hypothetical protein
MRRGLLTLALASAMGVGIILLWSPPPGCADGGFDPMRLAALEKGGWEAYYRRDWPHVFGLMVQLNRTQFCLPLPTAVVAAVDVVRASVAFAPADNDVPAATAQLERFYAKVLRFRRSPADAKTLAALEMDYWIVHRQLAVARKESADAQAEHAGKCEPLVQALAGLHAALFAAPPAAIRRSAELRAEAAILVDGITGGYTADAAGDWQRIEEVLAAAYSELQPR